MKKITFLLDNLLGGGAEKVLIDILKKFNKDEYKIELILITREGKYIDNIDKDIEVKYLFDFKGKSKFNILIQKILRKILFLLISKKNIAIFSKLIIKSKPDLIVAFMEGISTKIVSEINGIPKIAWVHTNVKEYKWYSKYYRNFKEELKCYEKFNRIICVSQTCVDGFIEVYGQEFKRKTMKIYNPIDYKKINELAEEKFELNIDKKKYKILCYIGRLEKEKGIGRLIKGLENIKNEGIEFKLLVVGDGSLRIGLEKYVIDAGLKKNIEFCGFQENPYKIMKHADVIVSPSYFEGFSLITAEALMLNKTIIATNSGGPTEILCNGKYGIVCENDDYSLQSTIKEVLINEEIISKYIAIDKKIINDFDINTINNKIYDVIRYELKNTKIKT